MTESVQDAVAAMQDAMMVTEIRDIPDCVELHARQCSAAARLLWTACIENKVDVSALYNDDTTFKVYNCPQVIETIDALIDNLKE